MNTINDHKAIVRRLITTTTRRLFTDTIYRVHEDVLYDGFVYFAVF